MTMELNLGDVVIDHKYGVKVIITARKDENGDLHILEGYEDNEETLRCAKFITDEDGRSVIVIDSMTSLLDVGDGYYSWVNDPSLKPEQSLELGQRIYDVNLGYGIIVLRVVDGEHKILPGYEDDSEVLMWAFTVSANFERLAFMEKGFVQYTYVGDPEVTEIND